jgi:MFS family permease
VSSNPSGAQEPPASFPNPAYAWYVLFVLFFAYVVSFLDRQILSLLIEPIKADLQISDTMVSLLHGFTFALFYTLFGLPLGRMADRRKRTGLIIGGVALWSLMTGACGFARNAVMLFCARVGVAVGEATLSPCAYSLISDYFPRALRGRAISLYSLGIFAGAGMAYIFGGLVAGYASQTVAAGGGWLSQFKPWQLTFIITALPGILVIALMLTVREPRRQETVAAGTGLSLGDTLAYMRRHWQVYFSMLVGNAFIGLGNYALFAWLPAYFIRVYGYTPRGIGVTFGSILLTFGTLGLIMGGVLADARYRRGHLGSHYNLALGMTALGLIPAALLLANFGETFQLVWVAGIVFCGAVSTGLVPAATQLITPNELRGQATALYLLLVTLIGLGLGPTLVALLVDFHFKDTLAVGKALAIVLCATWLLAVTIMVTGIRPYLRRQQQISAGQL